MFDQVGAKRSNIKGVDLGIKGRHKTTNQKDNFVDKPISPETMMQKLAFLLFLLILLAYLARQKVDAQVEIESDFFRFFLQLQIKLWIIFE